MRRSGLPFVLTITATVAIACGNGAPAGPSPQMPPPQSSSPVLTLQVNEVSCCNRASFFEVPWAAYSFCRTIQNTSSVRTATYTARMTVFGEDGTAYVTSDFDGERTTIAPLGGLFGCGGFVRDFDSTHKLGARYTYRIDYSLDDGTSGFLEGSAPIKADSLVTGVVINEFRSRGPRGSADQFVELMNITTEPISMNDWVLQVSSSTGTTGQFGFVNGTIGPGCTFLLTASPERGIGTYSGSVPGDWHLPATLTDTIGFALRVKSGQVVDQVAMGADTVFKEGAPLAPFGGDNSDRSYTRDGPDTNNNARDFRMTAPSTPRNSTMCSTR